MKRIQKKFEELFARNEKALIPFITAGDPTLQKSCDYFRALEKGGADIIELGMPFSDPMADGPVIQAADERSLQDGTCLDDILYLVTKLREKTEIPIVLMGYYNPIFKMGVKRFAKEAAKAGVDGCLVADLPVEESDEIQKPFLDQGIDPIYLLAPSSPPARVKEVLKKAHGYLYYVSMSGITGSALKDMHDVKKRVTLIRRQAKIPVVVGFGINSPELARQVSSFSDGVVIGSHFVKQIGDGISPKNLEQLARSFK